MLKKIFGKKKEVLESELEGATPIPEKAIEGSVIDPRLIVRLGKKGKTIVLKNPCDSEKCLGCPQQFTPTPPEDGKKFCRKYINPKALWEGLNSEGKPKTCPFMYKPPVEKEQKINPIKASRRRVKQTSVIPAATGSKESGKKNKKKMERIDSR